MTNQDIYNNIINFLINRNWKKEEVKTKYDVFIPPFELNFNSTYKLYIYNKYDRNDFEEGIIKNLNILSQIYEEYIDDLASIIIEDKQILSLHIENDYIKNAHPSMSFFPNLILKSKELLQEVANFSIIKQPHFFENTEEAERYLNLCNFFKNDKGSLITKIQLPNNEEIKEGNLFEIGITGSQINKNLIEITSFINKDIIGNDNFKPEDDFLILNKKLLSVNVTNKLKELYTSIDLADIDITLKSTEKNIKTSVKDLNNEKIDNIKNFSRVVREKMKEISENDVYGKIIQLSSRDVDGEKNTIKVEGLIKNIKSTIVVQLSSDDYKLATDAHKANQSVLINGILEKEKSQYKVIELKKFEPFSK
ncbi:MAG: hypothetical protein COZ21_00095 [Bacteroidetes bacterium CG_4_10_14_3_um_filter_31_20]|nr:hypothetical protein [Bacteroidota bacterium]PIX36172.1 MAG: hypothetical protein COZ59_02525 [Bacteroidetes bacterium CG_4_8_14_3_um_filter_31_14]PIY07472.1 MAG: hypothetical protein COZ21_00095 [Bacteroidetes bacterium CG_4_10_14_3_um_filter_31_20]